jgi:hypothetical protein
MRGVYGVVQASLLLGAAAACSVGEGDPSGGGISAGLASGSDESSATEDASTAAVSSGSTAESSGSGADSGDMSDGSSTSVTSTTGPPPECSDGQSPCGVLCVDLAGDPSNCGGCGISCVITNAQAACVAGECALASCDAGFGDCDQALENGCEEPLGQGASCGEVCKEGKAELCNLFDDNCDGACDEGAIGGCRVGVHRSNSPTLGHFYTVDLGEAQSGDLSLEAANFFYLYADAAPGLTPFHRCVKGNGKRFYTQSPSCEGGGTLEGVMGQIAAAELCGAIPLYRLYKGENGAHFYTTSAIERDNAESMFGFKYEFVAGYVWPAP